MPLPLLIGAGMGGYGVHALNKHLAGDPATPEKIASEQPTGAPVPISTPRLALYIFGAAVIFIGAAKYGLFR